MKKSIIFAVVLATFIFFSVLYYFTKKVELHYEENELTSNSINDKIEEEIYEYISKFDKDIILSLQVCDNNENFLSDEQMIDIVIKYIISNRIEYKDNIVYFEDEKNIEKDGTIYYSNGYVDIPFFLDIFSKFFAENDINIDESIYYDKNRNLISLIYIYADMPAFNEKEILSFEELDYYNYTLTIRYYVTENFSFDIKYYIKRDEFNFYGKYKLIRIVVV